MKLYVVVGLGQFGHHTAKTLFAGGAEVLAIDKDDSRVELIKDDVAQAICADATDLNVLRTIGVDKADTAVLALGEENLEESILTCVAMSEFGVGRIIVRAATELHGRILMRVGATQIIYPEKQMGEQLANTILTSGLLEQLTLSTGQTVAYIRPREDLVGRTLADAQLFERYRLAVIGIQRPKRSVDDRGELHEALVLHAMPSPDTVIGENDIVVVVGKRAQIELVAQRD